MDNETKLKNIFVDILDIEPDSFSIDSTRDDIDEWDSLAMLQIVAQFETEFGVKIPAKELNNIMQVKDLLKFI